MTDTNQDNNGWERRAIEKIALAAISEQRAARRWGILFKSLVLLYLFLLLAIGMGWIKSTDYKPAGPHTAVVQLNGVIAADGEASADKVNAGLEAAFKDSDTKGVILRINSPGGSPVEAGRINDEIRRLRALHQNVPLYAVVDDICASGGYYVAVAADKIFVDKASIVGSVGVIMDGFGFTGTMEKFGVERRALTAGKNKAFLDPFAPLVPSQKDYAEKMLEQVHQQFIKVVRDGRGKRLKDDPDIFSGLVWVGQQSVELGLTDGLGSTDSVARDVIKAKDIVDYTQHENFAEQFARKFGTTLAETVLRATSFGGSMH